MAKQFKVSMGPRSHIPLAQTPFEEGHARFVPESGELYIDAMVRGAQQRVRVGQLETIAKQKPEDMAEGDTWLEEVE